MGDAVSRRYVPIRSLPITMSVYRCAFADDVVQSHRPCFAFRDGLTPTAVFPTLVQKEPVRR
jgi:hypothetical protein